MTEEEQQLKRILEALERVERKLDDLPCMKNRGFCPVKERE